MKRGFRTVRFSKFIWDSNINFKRDLVWTQVVFMLATFCWWVVMSSWSVWPVVSWEFQADTDQPQSTSRLPPPPSKRWMSTALVWCCMRWHWDLHPLHSPVILSLHHVQTSSVSGGGKVAKDAPVTSLFSETVLESILSTEANKGRLPTVSELLSTPLFSLPDQLPSKPHLKISSATKDALK